MCKQDWCLKKHYVALITEYRNRNISFIYSSHGSSSFLMFAKYYGLPSYSHYIFVAVKYTTVKWWVRTPFKFNEKDVQKFMLSNSGCPEGILKAYAITSWFSPCFSIKNNSIRLQIQLNQMG